MGHINFFDLHAVKGDCKVFVETGAGEGLSTVQLCDHFDRGYCIELMSHLAWKLRAKNLPELTVLEGNSFDVLETLLPTIQEPCLFWLDAHYPELYGSAPLDPVHTLPLVKELELVLKRPYNDVILIDDLRVYQQGPFQSGNLPVGLMPGSGLLESFDGKRHVVTCYYENEGYVKVTKRT